MKNFSHSAHGFTLVELMVIVAIVAILAAIAYPSYIEYIYSSRLEQARTVVLDNTKMMERYYGLARTFACNDNYASQVNSVCDKTKNPAALKPMKIDASKSNIGSYYSFSIDVNNDGNSYSIIATPNPQEYSTSKLESKKLYLTYSSVTGSYAKCTKPGYEKSKNPSLADIDGCEVL